MTRKAGWIWVSGLLLACSGRFEVGTNDLLAGAAVGGGIAQGGSKSSLGVAGNSPQSEGPTLLVGGSGGSMAVGGSSAGGSMPTWPHGDNVRTACGVAVGQPQALPEPIARPLEWWLRLQVLIWNGDHEAPMELPAAIEHDQAGEIVDAAIEEAVLETGGIPGAQAFVRSWIGFDGAYYEPFANDWSTLLAGAEPAPTLLLTRAYDETRRGVFTERVFLQVQSTISRRGYRLGHALFGVLAPPEPDGIVHLETPAGATRREWLEQQFAGPHCTSCHALFDPFGYSLDNYDEAGDYSTMDAGKPVDTSGTIVIAGSGEVIEFSSFADLGLQAHERCDVTLAFVDGFMRYAHAQANVSAPTVEPADTDRARIVQAFIRSGRTYRSLIKAFAQGEAIREHAYGAK